MHLIELARVMQADREREFRRSWRSGWWAALRHPRRDRGNQLPEAADARLPARLIVLPER